MENWGLITFRETAMLYHEDESTSANKMATIAVIAHEITHMWFGNLVTCKWWSDLWLNEAFASYLEYAAVESVETTWNYFDLFLMTDTLSALTADSSATSHPIVRPVREPEERAYTSAIVYNKGASVLRMLEFVMGTTSFQKALTAYIKANEYNVVETVQLWDELEKENNHAATIKIHDLMDSWTTKAGFPYLNISRLDPTTVWSVPFSYYKSLKPQKLPHLEFITKKEETITVETDASLNGLLKINTNSEGFYLVNYPEEDWGKWIDALVNDQNSILSDLTVSDRTNFIIDSFYLSRAGLLSYETPLALSEYLKREKHLTPWSVAI
ncbi:unnamed protein product, partial [Oppiella nova]